MSGEVPMESRRSAGGSRAVDAAALSRWRELVRGDSPLWREISRFLFDFTSLMDAERLRAAVSPLDSSLLAGEGRAAVRLRRLVLARHGVEACSHAFPREDGSRIVLLEKSSLWCLAEWLGCLSCAPQLRKVILKSQVTALSSELALGYPAVFRREAYYQRWLERLRASSAELTSSSLWGEVVRGQGLRLLSAILSPLPSPLLIRFRLRFPESCSRWLEPLPGWECQAGDVELLETILRHEDKEGWSRCCC